jgi:glycosyltransferase involved in cell wall biosynthesis
MSEFRVAVIVQLHTDGIEGLRRVERLAMELGDVTVVCVCVAPSDRYLDRVRQSARALSNLKIVHLPYDLGRGAATRAGFGAIDADIVAFLDLDGVVEPTAVRRMVHLLVRERAIDVLLGSRWMRGSVTDAALPRRLTSRLFGIAASALFGLHLTDVQAPLKVFRRAALQSVFERLRLVNVGFNAELLFECRKQRLAIVEYPIVWRSVGYGWPVVPTAMSVAVALLWVRMLNSPLVRLPMIDLIGRRFAIPVKRSYSIMIFCWRDPFNPRAGGSETYLHEQARRWAAAGHRVTWFAQRFRGSRALEWIDGVEVHRWGSFPAVFLLGAVWYALRSDRQFDFIIDCMNGIPFFTPLFSTKPKVCIVHHVHAHHFRAELPRPIAALATACETRLVPLIYRRTRFLTVSASTKCELEELRMSRFPIEVIKNGVAPGHVPGEKSDRPTILYLGRLKQYKRVRKLIDALPEIRHHLPDARLAIAGDGDDRIPLQEYTKAKGTAGAGIDFYGRVDDETKVRLMQEAWVFGMPSAIEGWGIVVIEANACGTPAVAYDVPGLRDCIVHEETGLLASDDAAFRRHLLRLLTDDRLRAAMSRAATAWARQFSWDATAASTLEQIRVAHPWAAVFEAGTEPSTWDLRLGMLPTGQAGQLLRLKC